MKAFLCHSSCDKELVEAVARDLGRQLCIYDKYCFRTGVEFRQAITEGMREATVFVLFASREALGSMWVNLEADEAWYAELRPNIGRALVYLVDASVDHDHLPSWLQRARAARFIAPKAIAQDIRQHLDDLLRKRQQPYFVGRAGDVATLEAAFAPTDGSAPPRAVFVSGLPGIGRRSLVRHAVPGLLNLRKFQQISVGEGDSINDICVKLADAAEPFSTKDGFQRLVSSIQALPETEALERTMRNLRALVSNAELPILFDEGGLLDSEGYLSEVMRQIIGCLTPDDQCYLILVSTRRPQGVFERPLPTVHLRPLSDEDTKKLISAIANGIGLRLSPADLKELSEYIAGYPPAAHFAIQQARHYGLELVLRDKSALVEFRTSVFFRHVVALNLDETDQKLLRLLTSYSPLPLSTVAGVLGVEDRVLVAKVLRLVDLALVTLTDKGFYRIAEPIADAVIRAYGLPTEDEHKSVALLLTSVLDRDESAVARLDLCRVLFKAARLSNDQEIAASTVHLANDLITLTETLYHNRDYASCVRCANEALRERPGSVTARRYLIRALIQEEKWAQAEEQLVELSKHAPARDAHFLRGFLLRKHGRPQDAIGEYKKAEQLGWRGVALGRELCQCYLLSRDFPNAARYINGGMSRFGDNRYVLDLLAQIATRVRDEDRARAALARLRVVDREIYYYHRCSTVELAFGNKVAAQTAAKQALLCEANPAFQVVAQCAYCEMELGNLPEAEAVLDRLDRDFAGIRRDIRVALRCRLAIARRRYAEALSLSVGIEDKTSPWYKAIRRDALDGELMSTALPDSKRASYEAEVALLRKELEAFCPDELVPGSADRT